MHLGISDGSGQIPVLENRKQLSGMNTGAAIHIIFPHGRGDLWRYGCLFFGNRIASVVTI